MTNIDDGCVRFCDLLTLAEEYFASGHFSAAAGLALIAARQAFPGKAGLFGSPRLELLLLSLGEKIPTTSACGVRHVGQRSRNVIHVLSYARPVGGDSRCALRWIQEDNTSLHSVVITSQADIKGIYDVPHVLKEAVEKSGGFLRTLAAPPSKPLEQARELRVLCQEMDVVVLHLFPYDIVPVLALASGCDSVRTLFVNHSDHTFWIGASVAHSVVNLRRQPIHFFKNRRGLDPSRSSILPIPLVHCSPTITRAQAKRKLGYKPDVILLLTIASPFKYSSPGQIAFLDLVTPVLARLPQAILLAVGPKPEGAWRSANFETNGRIVPLGTRWNNDLLYSAADVYLDSVPFSSITSLLEAGSQGAPLLGYRSPNPELELLGPGAPGLEDTMEMASDETSYRELLIRLVTDAAFRRQSGERVQEKITSLHTGKNWVDALKRTYSCAEQAVGRNCLVAKYDTFESGALTLALVRLYSGVPYSVRRLIRGSICSLPYRTRLIITWRLHLIGLDFCFLNLLPSPLDVIAQGAGRLAKRVLRRLSWLH